MLYKVGMQYADHLFNKDLNPYAEITNHFVKAARKTLALVHALHDLLGTKGNLSLVGKRSCIIKISVSRRDKKLSLVLLKMQ